MRKNVIVFALFVSLFALPVFAGACYGPFCPSTDAASAANGWASNNSSTDEYQYGPNRFGFSSDNDTMGGLFTYGDAQATVENVNVFSDTRYQSGNKGEALFTSATENRFEISGSSNDRGRCDFSDAFIDLGHDASGFARFGAHELNSSLYATGTATFYGTGNVDGSANQSTYNALQTNHLNGYSDTFISTNVGINSEHSGH